MLRLAATSPLALVLVGTAALSAGCFDTSSTITTADYPTLLTVDPTHFRGNLTCGAPGLARYVVTLIDVTAVEEQEKSPTVSAGPVPCQNFLSFGDSVIKNVHYYIGIVDGYERDDVRPAELGSRNMTDPSSGAVVPPTWTTTCGEVTSVPPEEDASSDAAEVDATADPRPFNPLRFPTLALARREVILHGCIPFTDVSRPDASVEDAAIDSGETTDASSDGEPPRDAAAEAGDSTDEDGAGPTEDAADAGSDASRAAKGGATEATRRAAVETENRPREATREAW
jgi:hypothetical protein